MVKKYGPIHTIFVGFFTFCTVILSYFRCLNLQRNCHQLPYFRERTLWWRYICTLSVHRMSPLPPNPTRMYDLGWWIKDMLSNKSWVPLFVTLQSLHTSNVLPGTLIFLVSTVQLVVSLRDRLVILVITDISVWLPATFSWQLLLTASYFWLVVFLDGPSSWPKVTAKIWS